MQRKIHMQDQVRNREAEIMEDDRSVCVPALGMKLLVVSAFFQRVFTSDHSALNSHRS